MDGYSTIKRVWFQATGQPDIERAAYGTDIAFLTRAFRDGDREHAATWCIHRGGRVDAIVRTGRICHR